MKPGNQLQELGIQRTASAGRGRRTHHGSPVSKRVDGGGSRLALRIRGASPCFGIPESRISNPVLPPKQQDPRAARTP